MTWLTDRLSNLMGARALTPEAMARQFAVERPRIAAILSGEARPNDSLLKRFAKFFGEDPAEWLANVQPTATPPRTSITLPPDFFAVAKVDEVPDGEMKVVFHDLVAVANTGGSFYAFGNVCPHAGGPIGEGFFHDDCIVECPWHAGRWDVRTGEALTTIATANIALFEVRVAGDNIEIKLTEAVLGGKSA